MSQSWLQRLRVRLVDFLYGSFIFLPLGIFFLKRSLTGFGDGEWDESQIPNLDGKVAVVTGAKQVHCLPHAGIGYHTVRQLASKGAKVYLAARSETRANSAIQRLLRENPFIRQENLVWMRLDLSSQAQVVGAACWLRDREQRLDILVNNAGIDPYDYTKTPEGFEMTMAVNHIGHWTLTHALLPLLKFAAAQDGSDVRVVTLSSSGAAYSSPKNTFSSPKDLNDPCASPGWENSCLGQRLRYGTTKLANVLFASELQRRMDAENVKIISLSLNPGTVRTDGAAQAMPFMVRPLVGLLFTEPQRGADTTMFAATSKAVKENSELWKGRYLDGPGRITSPSPRAEDGVTARNLWNITESAVRGTGALDEL
ncbi:Short-chain dehydrogenase/reductase [Paramyrothecium foliicola]|nr:Short-chain dehydrogenase/reductase [Paramyrothecium foliicola]